MKTKIIIADDHRIIREGLKSLISKNRDLNVVAEAFNGTMALELVRKEKPDLVIMDVNMPIMNGIEATRHIIGEFPEMKIIALSVFSDKRFVTEMFRAGARGYMLKDCAFEEIIRAVYTVMKGEFYLSPQITGVKIDDIFSKRNQLEKHGLSLLSQRERQVLKLFAEGYTTKEIAAQIHLSVKTIESHRKNIMDKLDIHSLVNLTKFAIREGLTSLDS